jgi:hypothetical protein
MTSMRLAAGLPSADAAWTEPKSRCGTGPMGRSTSIVVQPGLPLANAR